MKLTNPDDWKEVFPPANDNTFGPEQYIENDTDKINAKLKMFIGITQSSDWIGFVEELLNYCPFVRDRGRPSAENVKNSIIGRSGYKTFTGYLRNELKVKPATWEAWRKAFLLVENFSYLREIGATSSSINNLNNSVENFPINATEWLNANKEVKSKKSVSDKQEKAQLVNMLENVKNHYFEVAKERNELVQKLSKSKSRNLIYRLSLSDAKKTIKKLNNQVEIYKNNSETYKKKYYEAIKN